MPDRRKTKKILYDRKLAPKKGLGQNFLVYRETAEHIVEKAAVRLEDTVIELGVGLGSLTHPLAQRARKVIGLEIDAGIIRFQEEEGTLPDNVTLIHQDLLKADFHQLAHKECEGGRLKILANLPYSISNPLLFKLIENRDVVEWAVLMLQKEVAQRLTAKVGTKEYGILSVLLGANASVEKLMQLGPAQFHPRPKVDSQVVRIVFHPKPERVLALPSHDHLLLKKLVKTSFQQRRKTLVNSLSSGRFLDLEKPAIGKIIKKAGLSPSIRPERLTVEDFVNLTRAFEAVRDNDKPEVT